MKQISTFPGSHLIKKWLRMGYVEREVFYPTKEGTPQGRPPKK
jgi:RNA-directed DNA polymerase